ncbi:MAG: SWIM zinc finger family protein [Zoogloeaceae bacterium]|jgi:hypothetical protein|nr:SWIM zinc finger family protein [Zoogloeaceae bacterium]
MPPDPKTIEALAPDAASLAAALKLAKVAKWVRLEQEGALVWGECQGSGANPYRVIADTSDLGYKCTCPSRKFPCKHSLALLWLSAASPDVFQDAAPPEWVTDWLGRRRKASGRGAPENVSEGAAKAPEARAAEMLAKGIAVATQAQARAEEAEGAAAALVEEDPKAVARREAAREKRAENTRMAIAHGLEELEQWIADQLRLGLAAFLGQVGERCRRIAARLVDQKAAALASRIDEMPARLLALREEERPEAVLRELGKLALLARAWRIRPEDAEIRRQVATSETREQIVGDPAARIVRSAWEVLGERIRTRRDGLVSHTTWLLNLRPDLPPADLQPADSPSRAQSHPESGICRFAQLLDFYPASAGKRGEAFLRGEQFEAALAFYPSSLPLRAFVLERAALPESLPWPEIAPTGQQSGASTSGAELSGSNTAADPLAACLPVWQRMPWNLEWPLLLPAGYIVREARGQCWWRAETAGITMTGAGEAGGAEICAIGLPLVDAPPLPTLGMPLTGAAGLWDGARLDLFAAWSSFGRLHFP